ncbi:hypothetical protein GGR53DRAFT_48450 [Hypoxylon sp. FL1150]|nr:hypothetical protein GGR53DRAFT_48450 [Hypoxylon sp. FL1150]
MSYQYPPPRDDPELGASQASYMGSHLTPITSTPEMSPARRRESISKNFKLKRSVSTPNVRPQGTNEDDHGGTGIPKEKRRNKLGYHRTPIACKHCRNRKIRCRQPDKPDVLGRCDSCINLQRECVYSAVNQQPPPPPPTGQRHGTLPSAAGASLTSPSTSPAAPAGHAEAPYHQLATTPSMSDMGQQAMKPGDDEIYSPEPTVSPSTSGGRAFHYGHGTGSSWAPAEAGASRTSSSSHHDAHGSWSGYSETADYPSYPPPSSMSTWPAHSLELSRINTGAYRTYPTAAVTRSLSYSDDPSGHYASPSPTRAAYTRHAPPLATDDDGSLSAAGAAPHPAYGGSAWGQPYSYASGAWYGDQGQQHSPEAHVSSAGAEDPSHPSGMYYGGR